MLHLDLGVDGFIYNYIELNDLIKLGSRVTECQDPHGRFALSGYDAECGIGFGSSFRWCDLTFGETGPGSCLPMHIIICAKCNVALNYDNRYIYIYTIYIGCVMNL